MKHGDLHGFTPSFALHCVNEIWHSGVVRGASISGWQRLRQAPPRLATLRAVAWVVNFGRRLNLTIRERVN